MSEIVDEHEHPRLMEALECPVCKDLFREPKQLECGHTYCSSCVNQLDKTPFIEHQIVDEEFFDTLGVGPVSTLVQCVQHNVQCPQCRKVCRIPRNGLSTNYAIKDMVEKFRDSMITVGCPAKKMSPDAKDQRFKCCKCAKFSAEEEMFICKECKTNNKPLTKQFLCAICVIHSHKEHSVTCCSELANTEERQKAVMRIDCIGGQAQDFNDRAKFHQADVDKDLDAVRNKLMQKLNYIHDLQTECFNMDMLPFKEDLEGKVREASAYWEQLSKHYVYLQKLKMDFREKVKHLDHNIDIAFPSPRSNLSSADQPSTSRGISPFHQNHFAYSSKDGNKKAQAQRRKPRRPVHHRPFGGDDSSSFASSVVEAVGYPAPTFFSGTNLFAKED